jgi:hypothetical protein
MLRLLTGILTLPYAPVRVVTSVTRVLQREAERELYGATGVRQQLEELDAAAEEGTVPPAEYEQRQQEVLDRLTDPAGGPR